MPNAYDPLPAQYLLKAASRKIIVTALLCAAALAVVVALSARARAEEFGVVRNHVRIDANGNDVAVIGGRPAGCPHAYCGCGLRKFLGLDDARLNLAWNWAKIYPRTALRAGAVAVWRHHVALVVAVTGKRTAILRDYNGGRHLSYVHERNVAGAIFVDPSSRAASASL